MRLLGGKGNIGQTFLATGHIFAHEVHVVFDDCDHVLTEVGIDITFVQGFITVELLLRHTQYAAYGLHGKSFAVQLTEYQQHCSSGTVPTKSNGLLEQQDFHGAFKRLDIVKVCFLVRQPNGKVASIRIYILCIEIGLHLVNDEFLFLVCAFLRVVRQLHEEQWVDVLTNFGILLRQYVTLVERLAEQLLVHGQT